MKTQKKILMTLLVAGLFLSCNTLPVCASDGTEYVPQMYASFWALVPPIVAIVLALITKKVYSSLFVGIVVGAIFYSDFSFEGTFNAVLNGGIITVLSDSYNVGILVFLVLLGAMVALMNRAGGSAAFGRWASTHIKTRAGAQLASIALGCLIFIDDYFNCLTVGSVMRPVTDSHKISRAKLSYLIDATAAPVCIIAPISSWAAAVSGFVESENGFSIFIRAIPYNYYALLTIVMMITLVVLNTDYGPMKKYEEMTEDNSIDTASRVAAEDIMANPRGKVIDLVFPVLVLIICCVLGMIYSGGFFTGTGFIEAFSNCDASVGLALGSLFAILITIVFYLCRRVLNFKDCMACFPDGFKAMVPAILILTFAWTLKTTTDGLGADVFVATLMEQYASSMAIFLPAIIFVVGCLLAFSTGTSWGTFGILIPIVVAVFEQSDPTFMIISISACMAGAVCGDHCSPISDTTIMASAGAQCDHVTHVSTQLPYAITAAAVSFITYIISGILQKFCGLGILALPIGIALMIGTLIVIKKKVA